jgi:transcriptional regulator with XRE-family HTH domain
MTPAELKTWRECAGLSATQLADMLNVETRAVNRWEAGTNPWPKPIDEALNTMRQGLAATTEVLHQRLLAERPAVLYRYREPSDLKHHDRDLWRAGVTIQAHAAVLWAVHLETGAPIEYHP